MAHTKTTHRRMVHPRGAVTAREGVLILLVAILAGVSIYTSRDDHTAFGLLNQPVYADFVPVEITFRDATLFSAPFLELDYVNRNPSTSQAEAFLFDTKNPPPVVDLVALNTRVGGEIMLYWTFPDGVTTANVYRTFAETGKEIRIAEGVAESFYMDEDVENNTLYTYRVAATAMHTDGSTGSIVSESTISATATVSAADVIPPHAPTDVRVRTVTHEGADVLQVEWTQPLDEDIVSVLIYRSTQFGTRGALVGSVTMTHASEYIDTTAPTHTPLYYTVVAVDLAGNASSADFQAPVPGNISPFTPFRIESNETD